MNSYPSKAAQKDALDSLNRQYNELRRRLFGCDDLSGFDLPYDLCHYRPAKHERFVTGDVALQIKGLIVAREAIKAIPVVKPLPAKQRREAEIALRFGENASLKAAMMAYAPALAAEFDAGWRAEIARRVERGDNKLDYISRWNYRGELSRYQLEENNERVEFWTSIVYNLGFATQEGTVRSDKLGVAAQKYGEETALGWYWKMAAKLGRATNVTTVANPQYVGIRVEGTVDGRLVVVNQDIVYKVSSLGRPFHQFPARIYVDGEFTTEAEFAKRFHPESSL